MKRWILGLAILGLVGFQTSGLADSEDDGKGLSVTVQTGINVLGFYDLSELYSTSTTTTTTNRVAFEAGGRIAYYFNHFIAIFSGTDFTSRGAQLTTGSVAASSFLDFPIGALFRWGYDRPVSGEVGVGGYLSFPLSNLNTSDGTVVANNKFNVGFLAEARLMFALGDSKMKLGLVSWLKDAITTTSAFINSGNNGRSLELGFGVAFSFL